MPKAKKNKKQNTHKSIITDRLSRARGHLEKVEKMAHDGSPCVDILQQLSAVIAALESSRVVLLQDHIRTCVAPVIPSASRYLIDEVETVIQRALK